MRFGSHVSIRNGYLGAAKTAYAIGAKAFQYFPKNPRSLQVKSFDQRDALACKQFCQEYGLLSIAHTSYTANIAVDSGSLRDAVAASLRNDLAIAEACGSVGIVVHFGKYKGNDPLQGYKNSLQCLDIVLSDWSGAALVLIENLAGEGTEMGTTLEECVKIRLLSSHPDKIGFCLDTCHLFASGIWTGDNWPELQQRGEELGYWSNLKALHLNDSVYVSGARRDRHANIGSGEVGIKSMKQLIHALDDIDMPAILETPVPSGGTHAEEIQLLKELRKKG